MIEASNLSKHFGAKTVVKDLSFTVARGEVLGFLGPNGAGKSTTMRMVTGFIAPSSGDAKICGVSVVDHPKQAKSHIGYLPESAPLYDDMTVFDFLKFCAEMRGLSGSAGIVWPQPFVHEPFGLITHLLSIGYSDYKLNICVISNRHLRSHSRLKVSYIKEASKI